MKAFVIDIELCVGCYACQFVCKDEHVGNDWSPIAKPQPDTGQFWMRLDEHIRGTVPKVEMHYVPNPCMHCDEAPCIPPCPIEGAVYRREDGLVIIDADRCTGCKACVDACPYRAIYFNDDLNLAQKCTACAHLLDGGEWTTTRCADACPTEAIKFGEESELADLIARAETLKPELGHSPGSTTSTSPASSWPGRCTTRQRRKSSSGPPAPSTGQAAGRRWPRTSSATSGFAGSATAITRSLSPPTATRL